MKNTPRIIRLKKIIKEFIHFFFFIINIDNIINIMKINGIIIIFNIEVFSLSVAFFSSLFVELAFPQSCSHCFPIIHCSAFLITFIVYSSFISLYLVSCFSLPSLSVS